jgi:hypothetical protein
MKVSSGYASLTVAHGKRLATLYVQRHEARGWVWWISARNLSSTSHGTAKTWAAAYRAAMRCAEAELRGTVMLAAMHAQREACAKVARKYPASQDFGDKLARVVRATPLVGSR